MESLCPFHTATLREAADGHMGQSLARLLIEALRDSSPDLNPFALRDQTLSALNISMLCYGKHSMGNGTTN